MLMKRIQAATLQDAMAKTRAECGEDALVIETQATAGGYVVIAARPTRDQSGGRLATATDPVEPRPAPDRASAWAADRPRYAKGFRPFADQARAFGISRPILDAVDGALRGTALHLDVAGDPAVPGVAARILAALLPTCPDATVHPRVLALVGPTGVGKTTTLAKLAAHARRRGERVAILTIDTYRVFAVEHLRAYADMLGVPFGVAIDAPALRQAVEEFADVDRIFIDTSGRSPFDRAALLHLRARLSVAAPQCALCLPAGARRSDALAALRGFAPVGADQLILTKWDETRAPGETLSIAAEQDIALAHVTIGQEVPDDIVRADADALASRAFGIAESLEQSAPSPAPAPDHATAAQRMTLNPSAATSPSVSTPSISGPPSDDDSF